MEDATLKLLTARAVKWNAIDRLSSQALYAVTGLVLAWLLSPHDFGLVGAILIFQSFASLFVDSGFSYALIQKKSPTQTDYSSVLWFNVLMSVAIYAILWVCAPAIAELFDHDERLVGMSRVMFLTFILNATSIVQVNRLTKQMHVRPVATANVISLTLGGVTGIILAMNGYGAWAIVWQSIANSGVKSAVLWCTSRWKPSMELSLSSIKGFLKVGMSMMTTSLLNTIFLNIYSFVIGNRAGLTRLGYYTQGDKWSKMGIMSLLQTLTSSFLPALSAVQDDAPRYRRLCSKMNRMTAYLLFPIMIGLIIMAPSIFHTLFGTKWDESIPLFSLLLLRGIFTVLSGVYNDYILSLGRSRLIVVTESIRDGSALIALIFTLPYIAIEMPGDLVYGIKVLLYGQIAASAVGTAATMYCACRTSGASIGGYIADLVPYMALTLLISPLLIYIGTLEMSAPVALAAQCGAGAVLYIGANYLLKSKIQADILAYISGKMGK